jgi:hypothetical protein
MGERNIQYCGRELSKSGRKDYGEIETDEKMIMTNE